MSSHRWLDAQRVEVKGSTFVAAMVPPADLRDEFIMVKSPALVSQYLELFETERPEHIVELGVKTGGSTALIALAAEPSLVLAIDLEEQVPEQLARLIETRGLTESVVPVFGLDQNDRAALTRAVDAHRPERGFDLVIDDASHILGHTRTSFEVLFPRLRPGGLYIVEDWNADWEVAVYLERAHGASLDLDERVAKVNQVFNVINAPANGLNEHVLAELDEAAAKAYRDDSEAAPRTFLESAAAAVDRADPASFAALDLQATARWRPLTDLAVDFMMIRASQPGLIDEVTIDGDWLTARRGPVELPLDGFGLDDWRTDFFGYLR